MKDYNTIYNVTDAAGHSLEPVGVLETTIHMGANNYLIRFVVLQKSYADLASLELIFSKLIE